MTAAELTQSWVREHEGDGVEVTEALVAEARALSEKLNESYEAWEGGRGGELGPQFAFDLAADLCGLGLEYGLRDVVAEGWSALLRVLHEADAF